MSDIAVTYIPDEYGIYRPTVTIVNVTAAKLRTINVLDLRRNAPPPLVTLQRPIGDYQGVAEQFRSFEPHGRPVHDIATLYGVSYTTAAGWINEARARRLLQPTFNGRGNGMPPESHSARKARRLQKYKETANV